MTPAREFTVCGANGFLAGRIIPLLEARGDRVCRITRESWPAPGSHLGHVIFTIGMTADFRIRPFDTVETQVVLLHRTLRDYTYDSFLYLSSTRVYRGAQSTREDATLPVHPQDPDDIYNLAKLSGESLCLTLANPFIRVARLSNVFGATDRSELFLTAVLREALERGKVLIRTDAQSSKDYIHADDAASLLIDIATHGRERLYNVAAGRNVTHAEIAQTLEDLGISTEFQPGSPLVIFPEIDVTRLRNEFGARTREFVSSLQEVYRVMRKTGSNA